MWQLLWKIVCFLKKLNTELPPILLLCTYPKELKTGTHKSTCTRMSNRSTNHNGGKVDTTQMSISRRMISKMWSVHAIECYPAIKRKY